MSMQHNPPGPHLSLADPRSVAIYDTYADAQKAVDYLADHKFPVQKLAIVGTDLKSIERVTGTLSWGKVLMTGAAGGVMWGLMLSVLLWIFLPGRALINYLLWGLLFGILYGMLSQAVQYAMTRGQRDFSSQTAVVATHYEVLGEADAFQEARTLLGENPLAWRQASGNTAIQPVVKEPPDAGVPLSDPSSVAALYPHLAAALGAQAAGIPSRFGLDDETPVSANDAAGIGAPPPDDAPAYKSESSASSGAGKPAKPEPDDRPKAARRGTR